MSPSPILVLALLLGLATLACSVPVAGGLDEGDANRIVIALDRASIEATKEADPAVEGRYHVTVQKSDAARAITTLQSEELPRPRSPGVLDAIDKGALVPSAAQEHAQLVRGMAGDLERTLEGIDGVLTARVHLNVPAPSALSSAPPAKSTASVLVEHRGVTPPVVEASIARLVAGGVPGLLPDEVAVVMVTRPTPPHAPAGEMSHLGPIRVAQGSMRPLQAALVALLVLVAVLTTVTLLLFSRLRRVAADADDAGG